MSDNNEEKIYGDNIEIKEMQLLPPASHLCQKCAVDHPPDIPHDQNSLYWHVWFKNNHSRPPTWEDAMAHCTEEVKEQWRFHLSSLLKNPTR